MRTAKDVLTDLVIGLYLTWCNMWLWPTCAICAFPNPGYTPGIKRIHHIQTGAYWMWQWKPGWRSSHPPFTQLSNTSMTARKNLTKSLLLSKNTCRLPRGHNGDLTLPNPENSSWGPCATVSSLCQLHAPAGCWQVTIPLFFLNKDKSSYKSGRGHSRENNLDQPGDLVGLGIV